MVDPAELAAKIAELARLEIANPQAFTQALADAIMDPIPVETAAFRSEELAFKALASAKQLIEQANYFQTNVRSNAAKKRGRAFFIQAVGRERQVLQNRVNGILAERGQLPNQPNPRRRAEKRMWNLALRGTPIPEAYAADPDEAARLGVLLQAMAKALYAEEVERDAERKRQQRRAARQRRKDPR